jgi:putative transposase
MARPLRIAYEGAVYHITSRGNQKRRIFADDPDRQRFLRILARVVERNRWICYAYCLMRNHFHLLLQTPLANISRGMQCLNSFYTAAYNRRHNRVGHLLQGRFKGILVEKENYWLTLCRYIVRNPVRAGLCEKPEDYAWSSCRATLGWTSKPRFLEVDEILRSFGPNRETAQRAYLQFIEGGALDNPWDALRGRIYLGSEEFVEKFQQDLPVKGEIPMDQLQPVRPALPALLKEESGLLKAYRDYGFTLRQIADQLGVHYSTISRRLKEQEDWERLEICTEMSEAMEMNALSMGI